MGRALSNPDIVKRTCIPGLVIMIFIYVYIGMDDLKGKYFLSESDYARAIGYITHSKIDERTDKHDRVSYYPIIQYQFYVGGKAYSSDQIHFSYTAQKYRNDAEAIINKYSLESQVEVFYEKDNPSFSVLEPQVKDTGAEIVFLFCIAWGFGMIYLYSWYEKRKAHKVDYS